MITILLTGGIGSGKSTVSSILEGLGAVVIDTDQAAHEVLDTSAKEEVRQKFGRGIITDQGTVDRKKLAQIVFNDPQALARLNKIIHTRVDVEIFDRLEKFNKQGTDVVVIESALISEAPWALRADYIWIVKAPRELIMTRLKERGLSEAESLSRMAAQTPAEKSVKGPKVIIQNNGNIADLKEKVEKLWQEIHNEDKRV
jgi:dephospho-CoA kinase